MIKAILEILAAGGAAADQLLELLEGVRTGEIDTTTAEAELHAKLAANDAAADAALRDRFKP